MDGVPMCAAPVDAHSMQIHVVSVQVSAVRGTGGGELWPRRERRRSSRTPLSPPIRSEGGVDTNPSDWRVVTSVHNTHALCVSTLVGVSEGNGQTAATRERPPPGRRPLALVGDACAWAVAAVNVGRNHAHPPLPSRCTALHCTALPCTASNSTMNGTALHCAAVDCTAVGSFEITKRTPQSTRHKRMKKINNNCRSDTTNEQEGIDQ